MFGGFILNGFEVNQLFREGGGAPKSNPRSEWVKE